MALLNGVAALNTSALVGGVHHLSANYHVKAIYAGDAVYAGIRALHKTARGRALLTLPVGPPHCL